MSAQSPDQGSSTALPQAFAALLAVTAGLALLPGLACGVLAAVWLRRRRLTPSWSLIAVAVLLPIAAVLTPGAADRAPALAEQLTSGHLPLVSLTLVLLPGWLAIAPLTCGLVAQWKTHRVRLQGGEAAERQRDALSPLSVYRLRRHQARAAAGGAHTADDGLLLGADGRGRPVQLPLLRAHAMLVGGSDTGKTNTASVLIEGHVASGSGALILDGKGGRDLPRAMIDLGARYRRPVALWSIAPYGEPELDELRLPWNVTGDGNPTEIKDRIATTEEQTEPYYKAIASYGLLCACRALTELDGVVRLDRLAALMSNHNAFKATLKSIDPDGFAQALGWMEKLTENERSGLSGMGLRLDTMISSDGGEQLLPAADAREINLYRAVTEGWLVVFSLPEGTYPNLIPHVARYVLQTLNAVCTRIEGEGRKADTIVFVDELSAFDGDQLASGFERGRSAGVRYCVATQSLSNFEDSGGIKLQDAALDNSELIIVHRQSSPDSAELLASVAGTEEAWVHTHKVSDNGIGSALGSSIGLDEPGERARRLSEQFTMHPNKIKKLDKGQAFVIQQRPTHQVRLVDVRLGITGAGQRPSADPRTPTRTDTAAAASITPVTEGMAALNTIGLP